MRLSTAEIQTIKSTAAEVFGDQVQVLLFGSRADDARGGGDIDLMVEQHGLAGRALALAKIRFWASLKMRLGDQRIDLLMVPDNGQLQPIHQIARQSGVWL